MLIITNMKPLKGVICMRYLVAIVSIVLFFGFLKLSSECFVSANEVQKVIAGFPQFQVKGVIK